MASGLTQQRKWWLPATLVSILFLVSGCKPYCADDSWVATSGTVKRVQGISHQGTPATARSKPLFNRVDFEYKFENKSYQCSQSVSVNAPTRFEQGQTIPLKVNRKIPWQAKIDLPPGVPDKTGMVWRRGLNVNAMPGDAASYTSDLMK